MWAIAPDDSPLLSYSLHLRDGQPLDCQLDAPVISLQVNNRESVQLYYYLKMLSGTLKLYVSNRSSRPGHEELQHDWLEHRHPRQVL